MVSVKSGLWLDHSEPIVLDATLTLEVSHATLLLSALAVMVGFAGASFWNIAAFFLHSRRITGERALAIELQQQVSLRNSSGSAGALWQAFKMHRAWSGRGVPKLWCRTIWFMLPAAVIWGGFTAAGILSSRVANKSYSNTIARVDPSSCGFWSYDASSERALAAHNAKVINDTVQARTYMTNFYANTSSSPTTRSLFFKPTLPYSTNKEAACPIPDTDRCILGPNGAFSMTTDFLDSHDMLGINAKSENRITVQISVTCSPINTDGLRKTSTNGSYSYLDFDLGPIVNTSSSTYIYNLLTPGTDTGYALVSRFALAGGPSTWDPISNLNRTDADVSVYFLSQNILSYMDPVDDPWFLANGTRKEPLSDGEELYLPNNYVNVMVCTDQFVYCNPNTGVCSPAAGLYGAESHAVTRNTPGFNPAQLVTAGRITIALTNSNTYNSVIGLGPSALFANNLIFGTVSTGLPDTQWQSEVLGWFQTGLAKLQAYVVEYASKDPASLGPYATITSPFNVKTNDSQDAAAFKALRDQCKNQLVQVAGEVQNFSFLGVMIIVCTTVVLVLLDWTLEKIVDLLSRCFRRGERPAATARQADQSWHLLRMAIGNPHGNQNGNGNAAVWELGSWGVPVLAHGNEEFRRPDGGEALVRYPAMFPLANIEGGGN